MGNTSSRATYSPNPNINNSRKKGFCSCGKLCSCSPFSFKDGNYPMELPKPPIYTEDEGAEKQKDPAVLVVQKVDLQIKENAVPHHTNEYHLVEKIDPHLVVRRGQSFDASITFNRAYNNDEDVVCLVFTAKDIKNASYSQGTLVTVPVFDEVDTKPSEWSAKLLSTDSTSSITVQVRTPCDVIVGAWGLEIDTKLKNAPPDATVHRYRYTNAVFILFNPWCTGDTVFMANTEKRQEYVLNDTGLIWRGSHTRLRPTPWNYAQFEEDVLECAIYLLNHVGALRKTSHNDPVRIARHLSAIANAQDDNGVIVGNWSQDFKGGEPPTKWVGSKLILQQYYKTRKPVKFGQCWVFSGVLTTVCRALGIPCRTVTNFSSAHDTQQSLTVDLFYNNDGGILKELSSDSIWNFHVWNEVWMERPDLEPGNYGGWQAIDATPQEESEGKYQCGPASIMAVKRGEIKKGYDVDFLFAEVNADKVYWRYHGNTQPLKLIGKEQESIGMFISTKAVGKMEREDITHEYKYPERSSEERTAMLAALRQSSSMYSRYYLNDDFEDIEFDFHLYDDIVIGSPFKVILKMKNKSSSKDYDVTATLRVDTMLYTGEIKGEIKKKPFEENLKAGSETEFVLDVNYEDYEHKLEDQYAFNIAAMAKVKETEFEYFAQDDFRVRIPDIKIDLDQQVIEQGKEFSVKLHFKNPLPKPLRKGEFSVEGPGLGSPLKIKLPGNVNAGEEAIANCKLTPKMSGEKSIMAKFTSKELRDVDGFVTITVGAQGPVPRSAPSNNDIANAIDQE